MATAATIDVLLRANTSQYRAAMIDAGRVANQNLGAIKKEAASAATSIQNLNRAAAGFLGFQALRSGIGALIDAQLSIQQIHYGLVAATGSSVNAEKAFAFVSQTAKEMGLDLESSAQGFTRLSAAASALNVPMQQQQELFTAFSRASTVLHLSTEKSNSALMALEQMFSKGKIQAQELRLQLGQAIPGAASRFQNAVLDMTKGTELAGKSFDQLLQSGALLTDRFAPALTRALNEVGSGWEEAAHGLNAELNRLSSEWFKLKKDTSTGLFNSVATTSVKLMADNLNALAGAATLAGGVLAARVIGKGITAGIGSVASYAESLAARRAETAAIVQTTAALVAKTRAEMIDAEATAARARAAYGGSIAADLAATTATQAHTVALREHAAAQAADVAAQRASTLVGRVGAGALALVGGPIGAAVLGIGALAAAMATGARNAEEHRQKLEEYRKTLEEIGLTAKVAREDLSRGGSVRDITQQYRDMAIAMKEPQEQIAELERRIADLNYRNLSGRFAGAGTLNSEIAAATKELEALQSRVRPTKAELAALEGQLRQQLGPSFDDVRKSILSMTDVDFGKWLRSQTPDVQAAISQLDALRSAADRARSGITSALQSLPGQIERVGKSAKEVAELDVRDWLAAESRAGNLTRANVASMVEQGRQYIALRSGLDAATKAQEANNRSVRSGIQHARQQENGYQNLIEVIGKRIAQDNEALLYTDRMTEAERLAARTRADSNYTAATQQQKAYIDGLLSEAIAAGRAAVALDQHNAAVRELADLQARQNQAFNDRAVQNILGVLGIGMGSDAVEQMRRVVDEQMRYQQQMDEIRRSFAGREQTEQLQEDMRQQLDAATKFHENMVAEELRYQEQMAAARADWTKGARSALEDYISNAQDIAGQTREIMGGALTGLEDLFTDFFTKGKADWKGFFDSLAADITRFVVRQQLAKLAQRFMPGMEGQTNAGHLQSAASALAASAAPLYGAAAALSASAAALSAAGLAGAAGGAANSGTSESGSGLSWITGILSLFQNGWAAGGYTGSGGRTQPAGLVHKGEGVLSAPEIASIGGEAGFNALRVAIRRGYADGGYVGGSRMVRVGRAGDDFAGSHHGGAARITQNFINPVMTDKSTATQRERDAARRAQRAMVMV